MGHIPIGQSEFFITLERSLRILSHILLFWKGLSVYYHLPSRTSLNVTTHVWPSCDHLARTNLSSFNTLIKTLTALFTKHTLLRNLYRNSWRLSIFSTNLELKRAEAVFNTTLFLYSRVQCLKYICDSIHDHVYVREVFCHWTTCPAF